MRFRELIPRSLIDYIRLISNKRRFKGRNILTPYISKNVILGENVSLGRNVYVDSDVKIGNQTYIHNGTMIVSGQIGKFCSIAFNCQIGLWEHPINYISTSPRTYASSNIFGFNPIWEHPVGPIIGNDVWIGSNVVIARGITVGDGAIIGAGAIVTRDIPPYAIVVGSPAKIIKYRFDEDTIKFLLSYKWWDLPMEELIKLDLFFKQGDKGIEELKTYKQQ